jgi:hypothetical protein
MKLSRHGKDTPYYISTGSLILVRYRHSRSNFLDASAPRSIKVEVDDGQVTAVLLYDMIRIMKELVDDEAQGDGEMGPVNVLQSI